LLFSHLSAWSHAVALLSYFVKQIPTSMQQNVVYLVTEKTKCTKYWWYLFSEHPNILMSTVPYITQIYPSCQWCTCRHSELCLKSLWFANGAIVPYITTFYIPISRGNILMLDCNREDKHVTIYQGPIKISYLLVFGENKQRMERQYQSEFILSILLLTFCNVPYITNIWFSYF
jgi:hypothetical protein